MKEDHKKLVIELSNILNQKTLVFLTNKLNFKENTSDIINLILSSNLSCAFSLMLLISEEYPEINNKVKNFIGNLTKYIETLDPIQNIEFF